MILAISGHIGSGKTTLGDLICRLDKRFIQKSFAYKLKQIVSILSGTTIDMNLSQEGKKYVCPAFNMSLGTMQQKIGTEVFRDSFDRDVWIKALLVDYNQHKDFWIITDCRFKNEAEAIKNAGGVLIRLEGDPAKVRENSNRDLNHPSETDLDDYQNFDYLYENVNTLEQLEYFANWVLSHEKFM